MKYPVIIILALLLFSCRDNKKKYKIAISSANTSLYQVGKPVVDLLEEELDLRFEVITNTSGSFEHLQMLAKGEVDFAISLNTIGVLEAHEDTFRSDAVIRTILPLYDQIFFCVHKDTVQAKTLRELINGRQIGLGEKEGGTAKIVRTIFKEFGIENGDYTPVYSKYEDNKVGDSIDVSCLFTSFTNSRLINMLRQEGNTLYSLGDPHEVYRGSAVEGVCMKIWTAQPYIVPEKAFFSKPVKPVLTISANAGLLSRKDIPDDIIYAVTKTILNNKSILAKKNPVFIRLSEKTAGENLFYPLHIGVIMYLERNKPTFLERYAEVLAFILSAFVIMAGVITSLGKWSRQRKKDRIDVYYREVMKIDKAARDETDEKKLQEHISNLYEIRNTAFDNLIKEKLSADESFNIFLNLTKDTIQKIRARITVG